MKIMLDESKCKGYANCVIEAPELFSIGDEDCVVSQKTKDVSGSLKIKAFAAVRSCPTQALSIEKS